MFSKKSKKLYLVVLIVLVSFTLLFSGCTSSQPSKPADSPVSSPAEKEKWPTEPITIIVPMKAGGGVDAMARGLAQHWSKHLGVPVNIENIDGGAGMVGLNAFLEKPDDGQTLLIFHQTKLSGGYVLSDQKYSLDDFAFINAQEMDPASIIVNKNSKYQTFKDLVDDVKANPGKVSMGTLTLTGAHLASLLIVDQLGLDVRVVNYGGGNDFRLALTGDHIDFGFGNAVGDYPFRDEFRTLAVFTDEPFSLYPDAQPINEALKPYGITVPAGLGSLRNVMTHKSLKEKYPERFETLVETYKAALEDPVYKAFMKENGAESATNYFGEEKTYELNKGYEQTLIEYKDLFIE